MPYYEKKRTKGYQSIPKDTKAYQRIPNHTIENQDTKWTQCQEGFFFTQIWSNSKVTGKVILDIFDFWKYKKVILDIFEFWKYEKVILDIFDLLKGKQKLH